MANFNGAIDSSEHNPQTLPTFFTANGGGGDNGESPNSEDSSMKISNIGDNQQTTSDTTAGRPRGRPRGSKNKTKPSIVKAKDNESSMKPVILEISPGSDIIENIINFSRGRHVGISIISASGSVMFARGPSVILSLSGSFVADYTISPFSVTLAAAGAQVVGGIVREKLVAATQVIVVAATFEVASTSFHKLPYEGGDIQAQQTNPSQFNFQIPPRIHVPFWSPTMN